MVDQTAAQKKQRVTASGLAMNSQFRIGSSRMPRWCKTSQVNCQQMVLLARSHTQDQCRGGMCISRSVLQTFICAKYWCGRHNVHCARCIPPRLLCAVPSKQTASAMQGIRAPMAVCAPYVSLALTKSALVRVPPPICSVQQAHIPSTKVARPWIHAPPAPTDRTRLWAVTSSTTVNVTQDLLGPMEGRVRCVWLARTSPPRDRAPAKTAQPVHTRQSLAIRPSHIATLALAIPTPLRAAQTRQTAPVTQDRLVQTVDRASSCDDCVALHAASLAPPHARAKLTLSAPGLRVYSGIQVQFVTSSLAPGEVE